ncbi:EamA family transporter [Nocardioides bizhenqiangii]|uniref:DMT family transporter n=1 Tax=Nocardioides bizhenqiangii TaxID=3095076 RepID=A0ABZ0ZNV6_9ACTN|nr:DMT family transporter [Nocardioides sp. HM61]WQQ25163.1 DMT family transporter [Nocardioides sp. HM61]
MTTMTHDAPVATPPRAATGIIVALLSAVSFALSGALASPMLDAGWSAGAVVLVRIGSAAIIVLPFGLAALRGRWDLLRRNLPLVLVYGLLAVAGAQFCYFSAVQHLEVGPALLIEYTAPAAVVLWMWARHGQRPGRLTIAGAAVAGLGLLFVLDVFAGFGLHAGGVAWALAAMVGAATYFVISADDSTGLPPLTLAAGGLVVGGVALAVLGLVGVLPMRAERAAVTYADVEVAWWVPLLLLGLVTAALSYVAGIAAARMLGSRLASFVALSEVVAGVLWAWLLLGELPGLLQLVGGLLVLAGVVGVKLGEKTAVGVQQIPA